ncbi:MAG: hypothetical protein HQK84_12670 [Nitrospinae bacterium]|nr:hypothetical protein [Nitrospinota bacterium]
MTCIWFFPNILVFKLMTLPLIGMNIKTGVMISGQEQNSKFVSDDINKELKQPVPEKLANEF